MLIMAKAETLGIDPAALPADPKRNTYKDGEIREKIRKKLESVFAPRAKIEIDATADACLFGSASPDAVASIAANWNRSIRVSLFHAIADVWDEDATGTADGIVLGSARVEALRDAAREASGQWTPRSIRAYLEPDRIDPSKWRIHTVLPDRVKDAVAARPEEYVVTAGQCADGEAAKGGEAHA